MDQYILAIQQWCAHRGERIGVRYAEGFRQHKGHRYPHDCILRCLLGARVVNR